MATLTATIKEIPPAGGTFTPPYIPTLPIRNKNTMIFSPTQVSGCALWLDGMDPLATGSILKSGTTLTSWRDKSGNGYNSVATGSPTQLANGGVNFNGTSYFLNQTFIQNLSQRSIFIVMQETARNNVYGVFSLVPTPNTGNDYSTPTGLSVETSGGLYFYGNGGGYQDLLGNPTLLVKAVYNDNMNGTAGSGYLNGLVQATPTANYTAGSCSGYGIGARWLGSSSLSYPLNGIIYEILYYNTILTTSQRQQIEGYLAQKWGLNASLPNGHPYKVIPPNVRVLFQYSSQVNSSWKPTNYSGCSLWLDAADSASITLSGTSVSQWNDKSGNGLAATAITVYGGVSLPTYQRATSPYYVLLSPNQALSVSNFAYTTGWTLFVAMNSISLESGRWLISPFNDLQLVMMGMNLNNKIFNGFLPSAGADATGQHIEMTQAANTNGTGAYAWWRDFVVQTTNIAANSVGAGTVRLGIGANSIFSNAMSGTYQIYEIIIYNSVTTDKQRQQVEGYLAWKWGLQGNLPATHPFKKFPPPPQ